MSIELRKISVKGKRHAVHSLPLGPGTLAIIQGRFLKIGKILDEFWLPSRGLPCLPDIIGILENLSDRPDIFESAQKLPDVNARYPYYYEWDNLAVAHFESYADWFNGQVARDARSQIRKSIKEQVRTEEAVFSDSLVEGICEIYNEIPVRQGKQFWHYGKRAETVKAENSTYLDRSLFIGAYYGNELIGFVKLVFDDSVAHIMQILSKSAHFNKRPNNALLSRAVELCALRGAQYLTYGHYVYGNKKKSSLIEFKKSLGFRKVEIPRYFIPLTLKGRLGLRLGFHRGIKDRLPAPILNVANSLRSIFYSLFRIPR